MNKFRFLLFITLPLMSLSLSSCLYTSVEVETMEKTEIALTYKDYTDNNYYSISSCPLEGSPKILVLPVWFTDSSRYITSDTAKQQVISDLDKAFFGDSGDGVWESVSSYFEKESLGALTLQGSVADWYECGYSSSTIGSNGLFATSNTNTIVEWAVDHFFDTNPSESRSDYDLDGDGYLDAVIVVYGAPDYSALGSSSLSNLWAYTYWIQDSANTSNPVPNVYLWASYDFMYEASTAYSKVGSRYGSGDNGDYSIDTHTYIHEMGHVFGLEDYYDYGGNYSPAGAFSMQDYNVGGHDPYSLLAMGWADPYVVSDSVTLEISDFQSSHDLILLTPDWNDSNSAFDEYLLLELYTPSGLNEADCKDQYLGNYPKGPKSVGIRLWHVDARLTYIITQGRQAYVSLNLINDPTEGDVYMAMSNTYYDSSDSTTSNYISILGEDYSDYNLLQLIRNSRSKTYHPTDILSSDDLFYAGDSFSLSNYSGQFVNGSQGKLNGGESFGLSFTVNSIDTDSDGTAKAVITIKA